MIRQNLVIDADDTLWENNVYFERAFDEFVSFLDHSYMTPEEVRAALDEIEIVNNTIHGYGSENFGRNMAECYRRLSERELAAGDIKTVMAFAERILQQPVEMIDGVAETLEYLSVRHDLTLYTKGHMEEQQLKINRSGLGIYFGHIAVVKEKNADAYRELARERGFDPQTSWMIGNSPKSDINAALAGGLNAVFIPHDRTWHLEQTELLTGPGKLLILTRFSDLQLHF
ncbi:MAG TPA: HAD hydrolase-like protein [Bryobacteraceae bacterium]|nr:HAD hydrolase-like protein [Bryobacteraceae bacterium]